jgi:hypothetical protein
MNATLKEEFTALENAQALTCAASTTQVRHPHELLDILLMNRRFGVETNPWWTPSQVKPWDSRRSHASTWLTGRPQKRAAFSNNSTTTLCYCFTPNWK